MIFFLISNQVLLARRIPPDEYYDLGDDWPLESMVISWIIGLGWSIKSQLNDGKTPTIGYTLLMTLLMGGMLSVPIGILFLIFT